jgi:hypothetical protein
MLDKEGIKKYVMLYEHILSKYQIVVTDEDLHNIYQLILLTFDLDDLYDSTDCFPDLIKIAKIKQAMISLMPDRHSIALNSIDLVFAAMEEEAHADLSESLNRYLSVCGKSIGAQLITGYLASKSQIELDIWLSGIIVKLNDDINDLIRLANDYLDLTVDIIRISEEVPQLKAIKFFRSKFEFKVYLACRYIWHKIHYYLYSIYFSWFNISAHQKNYATAINCIESVLDFAVKAYINDRKSFRVSAT